MENEINQTVLDYLEENKISIKIDKEYNKIILRTKDIVIDAEILKKILYNDKVSKKSDHDYCYYVTPSCRFYIDSNNEDIDLNYTYLLNKYKENISSLYRFILIFRELVEDKKVNIRETNFTKYNTDEIKVFTKFILYCINNKREIEYDKFIYVKYFDLNRFMEIRQKKAFPEKNEKNSKIIELMENFEEIFKIFDEIYDTGIFSEIDDIIEYNKNESNILFITQKENNFKLQIIKKDCFTDIIDLIKKIKKVFKDIEIVLLVNESIDEFFTLFKEGFINNLIIKNPNNKNLFMLKNNKDLFIYYDNEVENNYQIIEKQFNYIQKYIKDYFETLYLVFNINYKIHKIKITLDLSNFGFFIKDKVMQNYFTLSEYNEEKLYYSIYLYSKNNRLCYDLFCSLNQYSEINKILSLWIDYGNKKEINDLNSLILINGFELMLKLSLISLENPNLKYNKIILQVDLNDNYYNKFNEALNKVNVGFHTKNIYYVKSLSNYMDENKIIPTTSFTSYIKREFQMLTPFFQFVFKKRPILNKKPILLQISYFLSYKLNVYGIKNELDK